MVNFSESEFATLHTRVMIEGSEKVQEQLKGIEVAGNEAATKTAEGFKKTDTQIKDLGATLGSVINSWVRMGVAMAAAMTATKVLNLAMGDLSKLTQEAAEHTNILGTYYDRDKTILDGLNRTYDDSTALIADNSATVSELSERVKYLITQYPVLAEEIGYAMQGTEIFNTVSGEAISTVNSLQNALSAFSTVGFVAQIKQAARSLYALQNARIAASGIGNLSVDTTAIANLPFPENLTTYMQQALRAGYTNVREIFTGEIESQLNAAAATNEAEWANLQGVFDTEPPGGRRAGGGGGGGGGGPVPVAIVESIDMFSDIREILQHNAEMAEFYSYFPGAAFESELAYQGAGFRSPKPRYKPTGTMGEWDYKPGNEAIWNKIQANYGYTSGKKPPEAGAPWYSGLADNDFLWNFAGTMGGIAAGGGKTQDFLTAGLPLIGGAVGGAPGAAVGGLLAMLFGKKQKGDSPQNPVYVKVINPGDLATAMSNAVKSLVSRVGSAGLNDLVQQLHNQALEGNMS